MGAYLRFKIFRLEHGLMIEPASWGTAIFSPDYESEKKAITAIEESDTDGPYVILPLVFTRAK